MQIYLVGGAVRDNILGVLPQDKDYVVIGATVQEMLNLGYRQIGSGFPVFLHPQTKDEYALARKEIKTGAKHTDFKFVFTPDISLEEDLIRRDFTCNALAYDEKKQKIIDLFGGIADIKKRILRHISPHFVEDPLRVLRACRFAAQLDFTIAPETIALCREISSSGALNTLSAERLWQEIAKALASPRFEVFVSALQDCEALTYLMPEIKSVSAVLKSVSICSPSVKWAILLQEMSSAERLKLCQRLKTPKAYLNFAQLCASNLSAFQQLSSDSCVTLFDLVYTTSKQFKQLSLLQDFLSFCRCFCSSFEYQKHAKLCLETFNLLKDVKATALPNLTALTNSEIGLAYRNYRINLLQNYFKS